MEQRTAGSRMNPAKSFTKVDRAGFPVWLHNEKPVWIVRFDAIGSGPYKRATFYQAFRAIAPLKKGHEKWAVDNKRVSEDGFPSLREAMQAVA